MQHSSRLCGDHCFASLPSCGGDAARATTGLLVIKPSRQFNDKRGAGAPTLLTARFRVNSQDDGCCTSEIDHRYRSDAWSENDRLVSLTVGLTTCRRRPQSLAKLTERTRRPNLLYCCSKQGTAQTYEASVSDGRCSVRDVQASS